LQVLGALGGKVAPQKQVVDICLREERPWLVLLLRVEDFSEIKAGQRNFWQSRDGCPGETPKEVGVYETTILGCLEEHRALDDTGHILSGIRRASLPMEEMMKSKWSGRVWVGVSKQPLSGARTMPSARSVSSIICRALAASSKEEHVINKSSTYNSVRIPWWRRDTATTDMTFNSPRKEDYLNSYTDIN
jgi:hypothetical protein